MSEHAQPSIASRVVDTLAPHSKAIAGALAGAVIAVFGVYPGGITGEEWGQVVAAAAAGSGLVWAAPKNKPRRPRRPARRLRRHGAKR